MIVDLKGKVAIVTGGASGIGKATVKEFVNSGATVAILDRNEKGMQTVVQDVKKAGGEAIQVIADLADMDRIPKAVEEVLEQLGRIDMLIHCAAVTNVYQTLLELDLDAWDLVHTVNLKAAMLLTKHVAQHMVDRGGGGRIVYVASTSAYRASALPAYGSSKAGLLQLMRSAASELGPYDINVNAVAPGLTNTPAVNMFTDKDAAVAKGGPLENLLHRYSEPEDIAGPILFLCLPASRQITGHVLQTNAGAVV